MDEKQIEKRLKRLEKLPVRILLFVLGAVAEIADGVFTIEIINGITAGFQATIPLPVNILAGVGWLALLVLGILLTGIAFDSEMWED